MDVLETLYDLLKKRSRKSFSFFKRHAAGPHHARVFASSSPTSKHTDVLFLEDEEYIILRFRRYSFEHRIEYHGVTVIGLDERGRLWAHRLPWMEEFEDWSTFTDYHKLKSVIREAMGFDFHIHELNYDLANVLPSDDITRVRIQGDLVAEVWRMTEGNLKEVIRNAILQFIGQKWNWRLMKLVDEFRKEYSEGDITYGYIFNRKLYREFREFLNKNIRFLPPHLRKNWWKKWRKLAPEIGKAPFAQMPDAFYYLILNYLEIPEDVVEMWYDKFLKFLAKLEKRITVKHKFIIWVDGERFERMSDHIIRVPGVIIRDIIRGIKAGAGEPGIFREIIYQVKQEMFGEGFTTVFTIRDTELIATHPEHGTVEIRVPKFTCLRFTYLDVHVQNVRALVRTLQSSSQ